VSSRVNVKQANRLVREQLAREQRRRRMTVVSIVAAAALVIAGVVGWGLYANQTHSSTTNTAKPAAATHDNGTGIPISTGPVTVDLYIDFLCPICKQFETDAKSTLDNYVAQKKVTLVYHPIAILDERTNPSGYSSRAGSAAACASDAGTFPEYFNALYANQPGEGSAGLTDDKLVQLGTDAGITGGDFATCVKGHKYVDWMANNTNAAAGRNVNGTPTLLVNGKQMTATVANLTQAVG
jgi:protein-disulfide isomerase